jgi:ferric-dicitrate binding protein FerR (iron transport regulator)
MTVTLRKVALVLALAVVMYIGLVADPVQWWLADLSTALSSGGPTP